MAPILTYTHLLPNTTSPDPSTPTPYHLQTPTYPPVPRADVVLGLSLVVLGPRLVTVAL